ncbi:hypothetical protein Tco_0083481 [Tanacetum coccineum]
MKSLRKSTDLTANTPYYSRPVRQEQAGFTQYAVSIKKIRRIRAYTSLDTTKDSRPNTPYPGSSIRHIQDIEGEDSGRYQTCPYSKKAQYAVKMDDPNITMEEYIRLEEEKARKCGKVFNWETARYGKIWYDEDVHDLRSVETEFLAIVFNNNLTSNETHFCEPTVSSLNDELDFRISFHEFDDDDYTVNFDKKSFSYKIISVNDLKTDSENLNDKVNMHSFPSPEPTVSYFDDLDYFKDFEKEFPAIVYNDAQTFKLDFLTEPTISDVINTDDGAYAHWSNQLLETIFIFIIFYTAYSLNEYIVFDTNFNTVYPGNGYGVSTSCTVLGPRERNIDECWWKIYKSGDLEVLES